MNSSISPEDGGGLDRRQFLAQFSLGGIALILVLAKAGVRRVAVYAIVGVFIWLAFHESGVHATIAGVVLVASVAANLRVNGAPGAVRDLFGGDDDAAVEAVTEG